MKLYALIMAGGSGTRLWPRSRRDRPKQLLDIVSQRTMLQETCERIRPLIPDERIFVITNEGYAEESLRQVPYLHPANIIGELEGHGTAPAIGLGTLHIGQRDPEAMMVVLTADHLVRDAETFRRVLQAAASVAETGRLVTLGIKPTHPETGYGYIQRGDSLPEVGGYQVFRVRRFTEKPDLATAEGFVDSGEYYWNSGMFVWKISAIQAEIQRLMPQLHAHLEEIRPAVGTDREPEVLARVWPEIETQTIDYGVMEHAQNVAVLPTDIGWSDVGDWATLSGLLPADDAGNVVVGEHVGVETVRSLVYSPHRLVATVGIQDMVIVDTDDAILVCPKERAQEVRALVDELKRNARDKYL